MVPYVYELIHKYNPVDNVYVVGADPAFIRSLKRLVGDELIDGEWDTVRKRYIRDYKDERLGKKVYRDYNKIMDVNFLTEHRKMLSGLRMILATGFLAIDKKFDLLINALYNCSDEEGTVKKNFTGNDVFDSLRMTCLG